MKKEVFQTNSQKCTWCVWVPAPSSESQELLLSQGLLEEIQHRVSRALRAAVACRCQLWGGLLPLPWGLLLLLCLFLSDLVPAAAQEANQVWDLMT